MNNKQRENKKYNKSKNQSSDYQPRPHANSASSAGMNNDNESPLEKAARSGNEETVSQLLESTKHNTSALNKALFAAVEGCNSTKSVENHISCVSTLL